MGSFLIANGLKKQYFHPFPVCLPNAYREVWRSSDPPQNHMTLQNIIVIRNYRSGTGSWDGLPAAKTNSCHMEKRGTERGALGWFLLHSDYHVVLKAFSTPVHVFMCVHKCVWVWNIMWCVFVYVFFTLYACIQLLCVCGRCDQALLHSWSVISIVVSTSADHDGGVNSWLNKERTFKEKALQHSFDETVICKKTEYTIVRVFLKMFTQLHNFHNSQFNLSFVVKFFACDL